MTKNRVNKGISIKAEKKISIITPCFNEEETILECISAVKDVMEKCLPEYNYEHIFCDNNSTDGTVEKLKSIALYDNRIKIIVNSRNFGPFRSMYNGLKRSSGDAVITFLPVDMQDPPQLIPKFVRYWESGTEIVCGARETRAEGYFMRISRKIFYKALNTLSDFEVPQSVGEFQLIDRKVANAVLEYKDPYPILRTMIASVGYSRVIVPYHWKERRKGKSRLRISNLFDQAMVGLSSFSSAPLRLCIWLGLIIGIICFFYSLFVLFAALFEIATAPSGVFTLLVAVFFLFAVQFILFGVMGEYILQIHRHVRGGPVVFEKEVYNFDCEVNE